MKTATIEGCRRFFERANVHESAMSDYRGLGLSSVGLGTYLGAPSDEVDTLYEEAILRALSLGINVFDTALNYRYQRSERLLGRALRQAFDSGQASRDEVIVASKIGFLPYDRALPRDPRAYIHETFLAEGVFEAGEIVGGHHVLSGSFVRFGVERSLSNLGLDALDIYFLHNPEVQLSQVPRATFLARLRGAIEAMEEACQAGKVSVWGLATWDGLRLPPSSPEHLSLEEVMTLAKEIAGEGHHFGAIELPYNLSMPQAWTRRTQRLFGEELTALEAAERLSLAVFTSATLHETRLLSRPLPPRFGEALPGTTSDASRAIQFARSTKGVTTSLVGMKTASHVEANTEVLRLPRLDEGELVLAARALRGA